MIPTTRKTLVYVAGPYRDPRGAFYVHENIQTARHVAAALWKHGCTPLVPHLNTAHFDGLVPDDEFIAGGIAMLQVCHAMVLCPGWQRSRGTALEIAAAGPLQLPIYAFNDFTTRMTAREIHHYVTDYNE